MSSENPKTVGPLIIFQANSGNTMASIRIHSLNVYYNTFHALIDVTMDIPKQSITAVIGPSGCGKSTFIRCLNRMNDLIEGAKVEGSVMVDQKNIYSKSEDLTALRRKVGMVFQRPNPFPLSIFENCSYGPSIHGVRKYGRLEEICERALTSVLLWDEVKDRLHESALELSDEQQQRLCIARLLAVNPEILLMDEPCSTLDPKATAKIEELILELKKQFTIVIVTHNMQQAARISDYTGYFLLGELVEFGRTSAVFKHPKHKRTADYLEGRFG